MLLLAEIVHIQNETKPDWSLHKLTFKSSGRWAITLKNQCTP